MTARGRSADTASLSLLPVPVHLDLGGRHADPNYAHAKMPPFADEEISR